MDLVDEYLAELGKALQELSRPAVWAVIEALYKAWQEGRQVFIIGNGGSAATASHMANDLCKFTIVEGKPRLKALALTDNVPLITAWANDSEYADVFVEQLKNFMRPGDVLIAISASGNSANVVRALEYAHANGAFTIGLSGDTGGRMRPLLDLCVLVPDPYIGRQEDGHMILDHLIATALRRKIEGS